MFHKLVAIEPVSLVPSAEKELYSFAEEVILFPDVPAGDEEVAARIGDADAVLLSYTSRITREALEKCPNVKYIGMCCSLYSPESANVDIRYANERGITVTGIRDYGDEGVVEYVISELVRCLHGFGQEPWDGMAREITGLKVGIVGLGKSGGMIADALNFLGADITYYARSVKQDAAEKGYRFLPLDENPIYKLNKEDFERIYGINPDLILFDINSRNSSNANNLFTINTSTLTQAGNTISLSANFLLTEEDLSCFDWIDEDYSKIKGLGIENIVVDDCGVCRV